MNNKRCYSDLLKFKTFDERFKYLEIGGHIGIESFGYDRYLNQAFYQSPDWQKVRRDVILRDNGMDLGINGYPVNRIVIHHMNPISVDDVLDFNPDIFNPEYLISCSHATHNALHYGNEDYLNRFKVVERKPNDTIPWR